MLRRFNHTGRHTISKDHVSIRVRPREHSDKAAFIADLELDGYGFDPAAVVRMEASRSLIVERWDVGTVTDATNSREFLGLMNEVPMTSQFKVFVVAGDGSGRLLGASGPIKPKLPVESLIPLEPTDLGGEVWRVDFVDDGQPVLLVNNRLPAMSEIVRNDKQFRALVMPQVLRTVLTHIIFVAGADYDDDEETWHQGWFNLAQAVFSTRAPKVTNPEDDSQLLDAQRWIEEVVAEFSERRVKAAEIYGRARQEDS